MLVLKLLRVAAQEYNMESVALFFFRESTTRRLLILFFFLEGTGAGLL